MLDLGGDYARASPSHCAYGPRIQKKDAERELTKLLHELDTGGYVEPHKLSVAEYLECWLADYVAHAVSPKTAERYTEIVRRHLVPALGGVPLTKLSPLLIQDYYRPSNAAASTGAAGCPPGRSSITIEFCEPRCSRPFAGNSRAFVMWQTRSTHLDPSVQKSAS